MLRRIASGGAIDVWSQKTSQDNIAFEHFLGTGLHEKSVEPVCFDHGSNSPASDDDGRNIDSGLSSSIDSADSEADAAAGLAELLSGPRSSQRIKPSTPRLSTLSERGPASGSDINQFQAAPSPLHSRGGHGQAPNLRMRAVSVSEPITSSTPASYDIQRASNMYAREMMPAHGIAFACVATDAQMRACRACS